MQGMSRQMFHAAEQGNPVEFSAPYLQKHVLDWGQALRAVVLSLESWEWQGLDLAGQWPQAISVPTSQLGHILVQLILRQKQGLFLGTEVAPLLCILENMLLQRK